MSDLSRRLALTGLGALGAAVLAGRATATSADPLSVQGAITDQIVGPLSSITIHTSDANGFRRFLQGGMGMMPGSAQTSALARRFGLDQDSMTMRTYLGPNTSPDAIGVRIIDGASPTTAVLRPNHDALLPGAMSIGFPVHGIEARAQILAAYDFPAAAGVTDITLPRGDGSTYKVFESHHKAPDGVLCLCIDRADLKPVGPIDSDSLNIGGPAYSGMIVSDAAAMEAMLVGVFGWQKRRDVVLSSSGPNGGLGLPVGQRFIFQQYFAPGTDTGYLVIMQHLMNQRPVPAKLGLSQRGLGMLSFKTRRLGDVLARAQTRGITILAMPNRATGRSAILATPDGVPMEVIQA
jgi:catechol 2,3-dioxygenase-like lactoylglutathione lyase family enzyme